MKRFSIAKWQGSGKEGKGSLTSQSNVLNNTPYSYTTRYVEEVTGTNPEELMAAAHAGCFSMKLSFTLDKAGFTAENIETRCDMTLENGAITSSHLTVKASVPGLSAEQFEEIVVDAEANCPVSKSLNMAISHDAQLMSVKV